MNEQRGRVTFEGMNASFSPVQEKLTELKGVETHVPRDAALLRCDWFRTETGHTASILYGFGRGRGGAHQSKTGMFGDLARLMALECGTDLRSEILEHNVLGKASGGARRSSLANLESLYGVVSRPPISLEFARLWRAEQAGRPMLAALVAVARDPLLRVTGDTLVETEFGSKLGQQEFQDLFEATFPGRFSASMLRSLAQNCASTWTQSGHLSGRVRKVRVRAMATPAAAALAARLALRAGFGGPSLLESPWLRLLDGDVSERLSLLRRADAEGWIGLRAAAGVVEVVATDLARLD